MDSVHSYIESKELEYIQTAHHFSPNVVYEHWWQLTGISQIRIIVKISEVL